MDELVIGVVSDASHGNVGKGASQAGWLVLLMNPEVHQGVGSVFCVAFEPHRIRRIVRPALAAETMGNGCRERGLRQGVLDGADGWTFPAAELLR